MQRFGIDIGGTGMKAAPVDVATGALTTDRIRVETPQPATPDRVAAAAAGLVEAHGWHGPVGICMPSVVMHGVVRSAANIDDSWIGVDADGLFSDAIGARAHVVNDADAAGQAETTWGAGTGRSGVVLCLTFGTGIGSGLFVDGVLVPNTEFGHVELDGADAEVLAAARVRKALNLSWAEWGDRVNRYLHHIAFVVSPDLIILGGGASKRAHKWIDRIDVDCDVEIAALQNDAGIAGAALHAPDA
ncbi:MAG: ROK family protein [Ilumatobacter sp.]|nr:ROK family protein [Ilumatobacter sp.]